MEKGMELIVLEFGIFRGGKYGCSGKRRGWSNDGEKEGVKSYMKINVMPYHYQE